MSELILPGRFGQENEQRLELPNGSRPNNDGPPFTDEEIQNALHDHEINLTNAIISFVAERGLKSVVMNYRFICQTTSDDGQWEGKIARVGEFSYGDLSDL